MKHVIPLLLIVLPTFCATAQRTEADRQAILTVMHNQQEAWNRADMDTFMKGYWKSDSLTFIGSNGVTRGWQTTLENYKRRYPTADAMGYLTFTILKVEMLSPEAAFVIGKWHLKRLADEPGGYFTLLWRKINGKWVIVVDHTS